MLKSQGFFIHGTKKNTLSIFTLSKNHVQTSANSNNYSIIMMNIVFNFINATINF